MLGPLGRLNLLAHERTYLVPDGFVDERGVIQRF
jgi:hypothetical protein